MEMAELSDIQAEAAVIGTLIYHPEYILHTEYLRAGYFYNTENGCIYWAISELYKGGVTNIDAYNLSNKLQSHPAVNREIEKYNLPAVQEFVELYKGTARHTLEEYKIFADNVVTWAFKRDLVKVLNQIESDCKRKGTDLEKLNNSTYNALDRLTQQYILTDEVRTIGADVDRLWGEIVSRRTDNGMYGIPSKYSAFNEYFSYEPGELVVIQAKFKQGKSVFLMNEAVHKLKMGLPTLVVDSEMTDRLYFERLLSHLSGIPMRKIKSGQYTSEEDEKLHKWMQWLKEQPFVHIYDPTMSNERLYAICKMQQRKIGLQFVVYDYFKSNQLSTSENYNLLGAKVDFLKNNIAGELGLPVLAACQLNRGGEVADSIKINQYLSVGIKWGFKTRDMVLNDGDQCGNAYAKIYVNRLGQQMAEDDPEDYVDFFFSGENMTIAEAEQHERSEEF